MCLFALCACLFSGALNSYCAYKLSFAKPSPVYVVVNIILPSPGGYGTTVDDVKTKLASSNVVYDSKSNKYLSNEVSCWSHSGTDSVTFTCNGDSYETYDLTINVPLNVLSQLYGKNLEVTDVDSECTQKTASNNTYTFTLDNASNSKCSITLTLGEKEEPKVSTSFTNFDSNKSITPYLCVDFQSSTLAKSYLLTSDSSIATFDFLDGSTTVNGKFEFTFPPYCNVTITATGADTWTEENVGNDATSYKVFYFSGTEVSISVSVAFEDKGYFMGVKIV